MANINIAAAGDFLSQGTSGDDTVTFAATLGDANARANIGNVASTDTGMDTAVLFDATSAVAAGAVTYNATTGWSVALGANAADTFDAAFSTITFADGISLVGGTAFTENVVSFNSATGITGTSTLTADILGAAGNKTASIGWDGTTFSSSDIDNGTYKITGFDGNSTSVATTAISSDAKGQLTVAGDTLQFTPDTTAITGGLMGEYVTFTYPVELTSLADPTDVITVDVTYSVQITWTAGEDTLDLSADAAAGGVTAVEGALITLTAADGTTSTIATGTVGGDDSVTGGAFGDTLTMTAGSNTVKGAGGNDTISSAVVDVTSVQKLGGGAGNDKITGGAGADKIAGGGGSDAVLGGLGDDVIQGLGGNDNIAVFGTTGLNGGGGNDTIRGGDGDDILNGDTGNDELRGGEGKDVLDGGAGNDVLFSSLGGDKLTGGTDDDVFMLKAGTGETTITDFGTGIDQLDVTRLGFTSMADIEFYVVSDGTPANDDTVIVIDSETSVVLEDFQGLSAAAFEFA